MTKRIAVGAAGVAVAVAIAVVGEAGADEGLGGCRRTTADLIRRTAVAVGHQHLPRFGQIRSWTRSRHFAGCRNTTKSWLRSGMSNAIPCGTPVTLPPSSSALFQF